MNRTLAVILPGLLIALFIIGCTGQPPVDDRTLNEQTPDYRTNESLAGWTRLNRTASFLQYYERMDAAEQVYTGELRAVNCTLPEGEVSIMAPCYPYRQNDASVNAPEGSLGACVNRTAELRGRQWVNNIEVEQTVISVVAFRCK